jgi:hypothetical protein
MSGLENSILSDEEFAELAGSSSPKRERTILPADGYILRCFDTAPYVTVAQSGNKIMHLAFGAVTNNAGEKVYGKAIYHRALLDGVDKNGKKNVWQAYQILSALGLDKSACDEVIAQLLDAEPTTAFGKDAERVALTLGGDPLSLEGKEINAFLKVVEKPNGTEANEIRNPKAVS